MKNYLELLEKVYLHGEDREGRNGRTRSLFVEQLRWDLTAGFPAVTTKKLAFEAVKGELLWFLSGSSNEKELRVIMGDPDKETIWTANADDYYFKDPNFRKIGDLGRIYGSQFREWMFAVHEEIHAYDQIEGLVQGLKNNPFSRRHVVSTWNAGEVFTEGVMALPPCHVMFQCYVNNDNGLSLHMIQRSADLFLGVPFNIASYAMLTHMLAQVTGLYAKELVITFNDAHIYHSHFDAVREQLSRKPKGLPQLWLNPEVTEIDGFDMDDIRLDDYESHPPIKAKMIV